MLLGNLLGRKIRPRSFNYTPLYYDPKKDSDRKERISFDKSPWRTPSHRRDIQSPWILLAITLIIAVLIISLKYGFSDRWGGAKVTLTADDAVPTDTTEVMIEVPR
ncbi:MAG: hypothetical protein V2A56_12275 [bacterium]